MANPSPEITFRVNLELLSTEAIGPLTNERNPSILHPTQHVESPDRGRTDKAYLKNTRVAYIPGLTAAVNRELRQGETFTAYGQQAIYIRDQFAVGYAPAERAVLEVVT